MNFIKENSRENHLADFVSTILKTPENYNNWFYPRENFKSKRHKKFQVKVW